jgi:hypothetical protein
MYCSPRGWWNLSAYLKEGFSLTPELIQGFTTKVAASEFMIFYNTYMQFQAKTPKWAQLKTNMEKAAFISYLLIKADISYIRETIRDISKLNKIEEDGVFILILTTVVKAAQGDTQANLLLSDLTIGEVQAVTSLKGGF